jgi:hypothetical protein
VIGKPKPQAEKINSKESLAAKTKTKLGPKSAKVSIPGKHATDEPLFVNAKQARRMLILREKRAKKVLQQQVTLKKEAQKLGKFVTDQSGMVCRNFGRFTKIRVKDEVRSRVAFSRKRVNGLFVSKKRELELADNSNDDPDTDDPD